MEKKILKLLADTAGLDYSLIHRDLSLRDDLSLDDNDIDEIILALEDIYDVEFEAYDGELLLVEDLINYVKEAI